MSIKYQRKQFTCKITIKNEILVTCYYTTEEAIANDGISINIDFINNETLRIKDKEVLLHELRNHISNSIIEFLKQKDIELKQVKKIVNIIRS